jgi:hypothetical protein
MNLLAVIMHSPDLAEIMFLVAFILFVIEVILVVARPAGWVYGGLLIAAGLASVALGFLAL